MIKINKSKLSVYGIEFNMPDNFYIDIEDMECVNEDSLRFLSLDGDCSINMTTADIDYESAVESLMDIFANSDTLDDIDMYSDNDTGYRWINKPTEFNANGLTYASIKYETKYSSYYEVHFERVNGFDRQLEILLTVPNDYSVDLDTVLNRENVQAFFKSFLKMQ